MQYANKTYNLLSYDWYSNKNHIYVFFISSSRQPCNKKTIIITTAAITHRKKQMTVIVAVDFVEKAFDLS